MFSPNVGSKFPMVVSTDEMSLSSPICPTSNVLPLDLTKPPFLNVLDISVPLFGFYMANPSKFSLYL